MNVNECNRPIADLRNALATQVIKFDSALKTGCHDEALLGIFAVHPDRWIVCAIHDGRRRLGKCGYCRNRPVLYNADALAGSNKHHGTNDDVREFHGVLTLLHVFRPR